MPNKRTQLLYSTLANQAVNTRQGGCAGDCKLTLLLVSDFDYELPEELIAQEPPNERGASRMLVISRASQTFRDDVFANFHHYIRPGDCLVLNDTRVFPARLHGRRNKASGAEVEIFLVRASPKTRTFGALWCGLQNEYGQAIRSYSEKSWRPKFSMKPSMASARCTFTLTSPLQVYLTGWDRFPCRPIYIGVPALRIGNAIKLCSQKSEGRLPLPQRACISPIQC